MIHIKVAQPQDYAALQAFWLRTTASYYWFLTLHQWYRLAQTIPWSIKSQQTWVAENNNEILGVAVMQQQTLSSLCMKANLPISDITNKLLHQAFSTHQQVHTNIFAMEECQYQFLRDYGFRIMESRYNNSFAQTIIKMYLDLS